MSLLITLVTLKTLTSNSHWNFQISTHSWMQPSKWSFRPHLTLTILRFFQNMTILFKCRSLFTPGGHRLWAFHHIWCRIFDIDWLAFANIARYRTFGLFMLGRGMNGPIFQPWLNSAFSRGAVYYFESPPHHMPPATLQSRPAVAKGRNFFYQGVLFWFFSTRIKLFISSATGGVPPSRCQ